MSKRSHETAMMQDASSSPFLPMFEDFRSELDEHHDRRERIVKASRDITAAAKKIIFTLQRVRQLEMPLPQNVVGGNKAHYGAITTQFSAVSRDLQGLNAYRYARQISGGCQEYIEALSFQHFITTGRLISYDEAAEMMKRLDPDGPGVELGPEDYVLGIYDMTGELMRFAITAMATNGSLPTITHTSNVENAGAGPMVPSNRNILTDMRDLRSALESLDSGTGPFAKDVEKKMEVMRESVEKVEKAFYGLTVRGAERPKGWMPETSDAGRTVEIEG